ncbi:OmpA/MotB family protein [Mucilaginibacter aquatilis]|uniref:OmpA family protein n=1 Tax=Mucilaginibacter aquatilis TaxID=1517760 RepID=A0A6I4IBG2_9SPHI|nr:OmpA family protein [Mucilaginibacter aquatilis]MVN92545.1 OmpA family protein [Mucilaginibacter aquatilis]
MKTQYYLIALALGASLHSCKVMSPKAYKALIAERDSLQSRSASLEEEMAKLRSDTAHLHRELSELQVTYNELNAKHVLLNKNYSANSTKINQLSGDLQKREARLREVEDILRKRDEATNALKNKLQQALLGFQQSGLTVDIRNGKVYVSLTDKLLFPSGSIVIDEKGKQALKQLAGVLNKETDINLSIEGHTDNQRVVNLGQIKDNWDLSVLRATSVSRYLTEIEKIDATRITATGKGEFQPIDKANTPEARSRNRRIEIVLTPRLDELYNLINTK